jgi:uncharacterized C2H2 Zn-finger protein
MSQQDISTDDRQHSLACPRCGTPLAELKQSLGDHLNDTHRTESAAGISDAGPDQQPPAAAGGQR